MKTIKLFFTATVFAIAATVATAVEKPKLDLTPVSADRAIVSITNANAAYFELSVESRTDGGLVYYKKSKEPIADYRKIFDFENLEYGAYEFTLKVNDTKVSQEFAVDKSGIDVGNSKMTFDPYFSYSDGILKMTYLNFEEDNLKVRILKENNTIYESKLGNEFAVSSAYDLSKLEKGEYTVMLISADDYYSYNIVK